MAYFPKLNCFSYLEYMLEALNLIKAKKWLFGVVTLVIVLQNSK